MHHTDAVLVPWEHRPPIRSLKASRSSAVLLSSPQVTPIRLLSLSRSLLQVFLGLPLFLDPWGFHESATLVMQSSGFLRVWPIHLHFLILMSSFTGVWCVLSHSSVLLITSGQCTRSIFRRHELMKDWTLLIFCYIAYSISLRDYRIWSFAHICCFILYWQLWNPF